METEEQTEEDFVESDDIEMTTESVRTDRLDLLEARLQRDKQKEKDEGI
jgi:hypothetical protein